MAVRIRRFFTVHTDILASSILERHVPEVEGHGPVFLVMVLVVLVMVLVMVLMVVLVGLPTQSLGCHIPPKSKMVVIKTCMVL